MSHKYVYLFTEGNGSMRELLAAIGDTAFNKVINLKQGHGGRP